MKITAKANNGLERELTDSVLVLFGDTPFGPDYELLVVVIYRNSGEISLLYQAKNMKASTGAIAQQSGHTERGKGPDAL